MFVYLSKIITSIEKVRINDSPADESNKKELRLSTIYSIQNTDSIKLVNSTYTKTTIHNVSHHTYSDHLPCDQRDQNPNLPLPGRRRPPTLRTINPLPRPNRPPRSLSLQERHCAIQGSQPCNPIHRDAANHHQHRYRIPGPHAACAGQARRDESCGSRER